MWQVFAYVLCVLCSNPSVFHCHSHLAPSSHIKWAHMFIYVDSCHKNVQTIWNIFYYKKCCSDYSGHIEFWIKYTFFFLYLPSGSNSSLKNMMNICPFRHPSWIAAHPFQGCWGFMIVFKNQVWLGYGVQNTGLMIYFWKDSWPLKDYNFKAAIGHSIGLFNIL